MVPVARCLCSQGVRNSKENLEEQNLELHVPLLFLVFDSQPKASCMGLCVHVSLSAPRFFALRHLGWETRRGKWGKHCPSGRIFRSGLSSASYYLRLHMAAAGTVFRLYGCT